jgi:hypothetical protein
LIGAGQSVGSAILSHPFAPAVDGTMVRPEISEFTPLLGGESEVLKEILGRYDVLGGLSAGAVLPDLGKAFWQKVDLDTFATAAIKLALKLETGSEPTESLKEVSMGYQTMIVRLVRIKYNIDEFPIINAIQKVKFVWNKMA